MLFDPCHIPFSRAGRFLTVSMMADGTGSSLYLRAVRGGDLREALGRLCRISFQGADGQTVTPDLTLSPEALLARTADGEAEFVIGAGEVLHLRARGLAVTFHLEGSRYDYAYVTPAGEHCLVAAYENTRLLPRVRQGGVTVSGRWRRDHGENVAMTFSGSGGVEGTIDLFTVTPPAPTETGFHAARTAAAADFDGWLARVPKGRPEGCEARRLAAYLLWANTVPAEGLLTRPAVFMSKNHMINIWSWDNAFSALGLAAIDPGLAFDQLAVIYDHQHPSGALPDYINDRDANFAFTKPPVHGWAIMRIAADDPGFLTPGRAAYLRDHLARQVDYWLKHARAGADALPAYFHGNDSGWDNASFFADGGPVISPDLPTFLILACDCLAALHAGDAGQALSWRAKGDRLLQLLLDRLWSGESFGTRLAADPANLRLGQSLVQFMPLMLGARLPAPVVQALLARLDALCMITDWGPATESPQSGFYESDGYWRGPIWAPTTCLLWDGLLSQGEVARARDIAERFCRLCETSGMAENFDAISGAGLRDRAFAWTSAVYLLMSAWLCDGAKSGQRP